MKIIFVDDEIDFAKGLVRLLEARGFEVEYFSDGYKAAEAIEKKPPDIILTDMKMPGVHGMMMLLTAKSLAPQAHLVVLSGNTKQQSESDYEGTIEVPYFEKPFDEGLFEHLQSLSPVEHQSTPQSIFELESIAKDYETWQRGLYTIAQCSLDFYDFSGNFVATHGTQAYENIDTARENFNRGVTYLCKGNSNKEEAIVAQFKQNNFNAATEIIRNWQDFLGENCIKEFTQPQEISFMLHEAQQISRQTKNILRFEDNSQDSPLFLLDDTRLTPHDLCTHEPSKGVLEMAKLKRAILNL
ncbi:MAG: response regulator [Zetaproteobacteria bacterium]|nr:response regulator [Zetaproteobacteria bacterium]